MDIEWAEYDCIDVILDSNDKLFNFKKWFIEFHLWDNKEFNLNKVKNIVNWLKEKNYKIEFYDVLKNIYISELNNDISNVF